MSNNANSLNTHKHAVERFNKWLFENKFAPNSSFLWFDYTKPRDDVRFFEIGELYDCFESGLSADNYATDKDNRISDTLNDLSKINTHE